MNRRVFKRESARRDISRGTKVASMRFTVMHFELITVQHWREFTYANSNVASGAANLSDYSNLFADLKPAGPLITLSAK
jgi:hypothetical protein